MPELKTFIFTDLVRSVELKNEMHGTSATERDMAFVEQVLTPHRERIDAGIEAHSGRIVSTAGDGHFLVFSDTLLAARWAIDVQRNHHNEPIQTPQGRAVEVRISMHVGVPQTDPRDPDNFVGKPVDYAARLNEHATGGQILVSRSVMAILEDVGLDGVTIHHHGQRQLQGIGNVPVHELVYDDAGPRQTRQHPKQPDQRQWTVLPTAISGTAPMSSSSRTLEYHQLGNYELGPRLGSGGMGDVYQARHRQFGRTRAVKVIKSQYVDAGHEEIVRRFYQEIKAIGALEHKNIVVAIDSSTPHDQVHYLVMEYIDGISVLDLVERHGPLAVADACEITRQAARGLQYIFKNGMVHRDIKPSNLMLTVVDADQLDTDTALAGRDEGQRAVVKILDLGLALLVDDDERLTRLEQKAMGTGMYMSPEQWKTTSVDIRADIYSLGCTLYHLLAGNPPFHDSDLRPEKAHERLRLPPIRNGTHVPRKLWDILRKMVAKRPEDRYQTPAEVVAALLPFADGHGLVALVRDFSAAGPHTTKLLPTQRDTTSYRDTFWSRAGSICPSRRWFLRSGLPFAGIGAVVAGAWWVTREQNRRRREELEESNRLILTGLARRVAENMIGEAIEKRFRRLEEHAQDADLRDTLIAIQQRAQDGEVPEQLSDLDEQLGKLRDWIEDRFMDGFRDEIRADSWFVTDHRGIQVARSPESPSSYLQSFANRDYFHGEGRNRRGDEQSPPSPIRDRHLSAVYRSKTSGQLKVAFSVPVWRDTDRKLSDDVLGVLAMSVELGALRVLDLEDEFLEKNEVVVIDLREDDVEAGTHRGLILDHPELNQRKQRKPPRVEPALLAQITKLLDDAAGDSAVAGRLFLRNYRDPLSDSDRAYCGAYYPVPPGSSTQASKRGWIVLVQTPLIW